MSDADAKAFEAERVARIRAGWKATLQSGVVFADRPVNGPRGSVRIAVNGWDLHELYTLLVEPDGEEGCCAGCTILPPGWCAGCDLTRKEPG